MWEDVFLTDLLVYAELVESSLNFFSNTRKDYSHSPLACTLTEVTKVIDTCRIDERNLSHSYYTNLRT